MCDMLVYPLVTLDKLNPTPNLAQNKMDLGYSVRIYVTAVGMSSLPMVGHGVVKQKDIKILCSATLLDSLHMGVIRQLASSESG